MLKVWLLNCCNVALKRYHYLRKWSFWVLTVFLLLCGFCDLWKNGIFTGFLWNCVPYTLYHVSCDRVFLSSLRPLRQKSCCYMILPVSCTKFQLSETTESQHLKWFWVWDLVDLTRCIWKCDILSRVENGEAKEMIKIYSQLQRFRS